MQTKEESPVMFLEKFDVYFRNKFLSVNYNNSKYKIAFQLLFLKSL